MTDEQLLYCFNNDRYRLTAHNGQECCRLLTDNGLTGTEHKCKGTATIVNGRVVVKDTCGEPCSYVCDDTRNFADEVMRLVTYEKIIELAKKRL